MALLENERVQEWLLMANDRVSTLKKIWWLVLGIVVLAALPLFFIFKYSAYTLFMSGYQPPVVNMQRPVDEPLQHLDKMIFDLGNQTYSGFVRIKNINLERGVRELIYTAEFKTTGGTVLSRVVGMTFVLPASEKILVFARFPSDKKPDTLEFSFQPPKFNYEPDVPAINLEVERVQLQTQNGEFTVTAGVKNLSAFTVKQIHLPILLYDNANRVVGVNSTIVDSVKSSEIRTFRFVWPRPVAGAVRAEIHPEINLFERNIISTEVNNEVMDR